MIRKEPLENIALGGGKSLGTIALGASCSWRLPERYLAVAALLVGLLCKGCLKGSKQKGRVEQSRLEGEEDRLGMYRLEGYCA
jgi:hypothetical protein